MTPTRPTGASLSHAAGHATSSIDTDNAARGEAVVGVLKAVYRRIEGCWLALLNLLMLPSGMVLFHLRNETTVDLILSLDCQDIGMSSTLFYEDVGVFDWGACTHFPVHVLTATMTCDDAP